MDDSDVQLHFRFDTEVARWLTRHATEANPTEVLATDVRIFASHKPQKMDKSVRQHIFELERRIHHLSQEMMQNRKTRTERNQMEAELRVAQQALELYQRAIKLEGQLQQG